MISAIAPVSAAAGAVASSLPLPAEVTPALAYGDTYISRAGVATSAFGSSATLDLTSFEQGHSGDCGAISGILAVAAAQPAVLQKNLAYLGRDAGGVDSYSVKLFLNGSWQTVVVNADTPATGATPANQQSPVLWGLLYEKALAAAVQGYPALLGINTTAVMTLLTGAAASQNPGDGAGALKALAAHQPVTSVGVSSGQAYYDSVTGDWLSDGSSANAIYIYDQHYYAAAGFTDATNQSVVLFNPWNEGNGFRGRFILSAKAYAKIFWAYSFTN